MQCLLLLEILTCLGIVLAVVTAVSGRSAGLALAGFFGSENEIMLKNGTTAWPEPRGISKVKAGGVSALLVRLSSKRNNFRLGVYVSIIVQCVLGLMIPFPSNRAVILIALTKLVTSRFRSIILMFIISWAFQVCLLPLA